MEARETLITLSRSASDQSKKSVDSISILVVDDDTTCLFIVAAILKKFKYEVVTVKHPNDALCTLRLKKAAFDLVVSDVHMPDMDGFQLQQAIAREFNLPVVLMSADDKEGVVLKGLESGAAYFIVKPVCPDDLRDLWQFAVVKKTTTQVVNNIHQDKMKKYTSYDQMGMISTNSSVSGDHTNNLISSKRKSARKEGSREKKLGENYQSSSQKKHKVIWTNSLHNRFLEAIRNIGLDRAVPKKILEVMNVPGLTRENVASHLQKYRIFLRRVSDASYKLQYSAEHHKGLTRNFRSTNNPESSSSATSLSTLTLNRFSKLNYQNCGSQSHVTSSITQAGLSQSRLLSNKESFLKPNIQTLNLNSLISSNVPSKNYTYQTKYVGFSISNIKHLTLSGNKDKYGGAINLQNDNINLQNVGNSNSFVVHDKGGEQLSDVNADYRISLLPSNLPYLCGLENGGEYHEPADSNFSPLDMSEFDVLSTQQLLFEEGNLDTSFAGQVDIQNRAEQNRGETITSSNFYGSMHQSVDNLAPSIDQTPNYMKQCIQDLGNPQEFDSSSQLNRTVVVPPYERDDDDFLESLLAPFGEDQSIEEI